MPIGRKKRGRPKGLRQTVATWRKRRRLGAQWLTRLKRRPLKMRPSLVKRRRQKPLKALPKKRRRYRTIVV